MSQDSLSVLLRSLSLPHFLIAASTATPKSVVNREALQWASVFGNDQGVHFGQPDPFLNRPFEFLEPFHLGLCFPTLSCCFPSHVLFWRGDRDDLWKSTESEPELSRSRKIFASCVGNNGMLT